jgi:hypothetical protein
MMSIVGVTSGRSRLRWQVQQVTTCRPLKLSLLMPCIIVTIRRAVRFLGVSAAQSTRSVPAASWQSEQSNARAAHMTPIVPMKSSTGMPLSTWTFLKASSDINGRFDGVVCAETAPPPASQAIPINHATPSPAARIPRANGLTLVPILNCISIPSFFPISSRVAANARRYYTVMRMIGSVLVAAFLGAQVSAPSTRETASQAPALTGHPVGSMSELMVDVIYPASDAVFYISTRTPKDAAEWTELQGKTLMLAESANLLMAAGRARDNERWMNDARLLLDAGAAAFAAAKKKDVDALVDLNDQLYTSCVTCHQHYRANYGRR